MSADNFTMHSTETLHVKNDGVPEPGSKSRPASRLLIALVTLFIITTVVLAIVLAVVAVRLQDKEDDDKYVSDQKEKEADDVCLTEGCVLAAARVRNAIDDSVEPCDNFYDFACGSWNRKHVIPEDKASFGTFTKLGDDVEIMLRYLLEANDTVTEIERKARSLYRTCLDVDAIEDRGLAFIHQYLTERGGWPVLSGPPGSGWHGNVTLEHLLALIRKDSSSVPLVQLSVAQDFKNPDKFIIELDQPSLGMPGRDYYLKGRNDTVLLAYEKVIRDLAVAMGADETTAADDARDMVDFEIEIANITVRKEDRRDFEKLYNVMALGDLKNNFTDMFDWTLFVKTVFDHVATAVNESEAINVASPQYFSKFMEVVGSYNIRTVMNYILMRLVKDSVFYMPKAFRTIGMAYDEAVRGIETWPPRWKSCVRAARNSMPQVAGRLFVQEHFHQDAKHDVLQMIEELQLAFNGMLGELDWMDEETKAVARDKADVMEPRIGYPDEVYNISRLTARFENATVYEDDAIRTKFSFSMDYAVRTLMDLRKTYDKTIWDMSAAEVNAYYAFMTNQMNFPAGILQPPFYTTSQPAYLNYGGIGFVIGHELTHGFDDQGRQFDKKGRMEQWWNADVISRFGQQKQCMIDQYNNYTVPDTGGMHINGINTQGENIADNGGVKQSFKAYRHWVSTRGEEEPRLPGLPFTQNQLFFINTAQVWCSLVRSKEKIRLIRIGAHSLNKYRVLGPFHNSKEFSEAFNCPVGSFMNKGSKCRVW